jgi:hypothetical protein
LIPAFAGMTTDDHKQRSPEHHIVRDSYFLTYNDYFESI